MSPTEALALLADETAAEAEAASGGALERAVVAAAYEKMRPKHPSPAPP